MGITFPRWEYQSANICIKLKYIADGINTG